MTRLFYLIRLRVLAHLMLCMLLLPSFAHASEYVLIVTLREQIAEQTLSLVSVTLSKGRANVSAFQQIDGRYSATLVSKAKVPLFTQKFDLSGYLPDVPQNQQPKELPLSLSIPYLLDGSAIEITDPKGAGILSIPVPSLEELVDKAIETTVLAQEGKLPKFEFPIDRPAAPLQQPLQPVPLPLYPLIAGIAAFLLVLVARLLARKEYKKKENTLPTLDNADKQE